MKWSPGFVRSLAIMLIVTAVVVCVAILAARLVKARTRRRKVGELWLQALDMAAEGQGHIAYVNRVYQRARNGSKAIITWHETRQRQDAWFKGYHAARAPMFLCVG